MTDTDPPRPVPQYGEYATPEQQQERIRQSGGTSPAAPLPAPSPVVVAPILRDPAAVAPVRPARRGDRFITIALLAYGLFTVVTTLPQLIEFSGFAQTWLDTAGVDAEFTAVAEGRLWGGIAAALFALGWIVTAALSWRGLTRGRLTWWIPLVGAVATFIVVSICLSVPLLGDPAIVEQILRSS